MRFPRPVRLPLAAFAVVCALAGQAVAAPVPAADHHRAAAATVLTYDASGSAEFADAVTRGATIWNDSVTRVRLRPASSGQRANVTVVADDGWPETRTTSLGNGTIDFGREAVDEGYDPVRIAAHEMGHVLGLQDNKPGPCSSLMSGASAGTSCTNATPDADEKAQVEANFAQRVGQRAGALREPALRR